MVSWTWENILATLSLQPHEVAYALAKDASLVPWIDALGPLRKATAAGQAGTDLTHIVRSYLDSLDPVFLLIVVDNTVKVLYGLKPCHATTGNGQRFLGLIGDREIRAGQEVHPKLHTLGGNLNKQADHFALTTIAAPTLADITSSFLADATLALVPALGPDPVTNNAAPTVFTWYALPIHPKLACLFLRGMSVRDAFFLATKIVSAVPTSLLGDLEPFTNFIRSAVTGTNGVSSITSGWKRESHTTSDQLETWYYELIARYAPKYIQPLILPVMNAIPQPMPTQVTASDTVLQELTAQLRGEERNTKPYHSMELHMLFGVSGVERPWVGLTDVSLPAFWQEFKEFRKSTANARLFVETFRETHYPIQRLKHPYLFTPQFIKDLKGLSFSGNDPLIHFKNRHTGVSIFSLAPLSEFGADMGARDKFLHYEETMSRHMPVDRAAMESLSVVSQALPSDRMSLYSWVDSFHIGLEIFFGSMCPLIPPCDDLLELLRNPVNFSGFTPADFRVVLWMLHRATRLFFMSMRTLHLERLIADLAGGMRPALNNLPEEMRGPMIVSDDGSTSWSSASSSLSDSHSLPLNKRQKSEPPKSAPYASRFKTEIDRAQSHWSNKGTGFFRISRLCNLSQMNEIFGPDFLALVPQGKPPCFCYHICGSCKGASTGGTCTMTHSLRSEPPKSILDGILKRLELRVTQFLREPIHPKA